MMAERLARLRAWARGEEPPPETFEIGLTASCNQSCRFCWRQSPSRRMVEDALDTARIESLVSEAAAMGVRYLRVIGEGEPLLRPDATRILEAAKRTGLTCFLCTNGTLFTQALLDDLVEWGWDWVNVSIEGPDAATHDALTRRPGSFDRVRAALAHLAARKRALGTDWPRVNAGVTLVAENFRGLPGLPALAGDLGLFGIYIEPVTANSPESARLKLSPGEAAEWMDVRERFRDAARASGIWTNADEVDARRILLTNHFHTDLSRQDPPRAPATPRAQASPLASALCFHPFWFVSIRSNGDVGSCGTFSDFNTVSLREGSLERVWRGGWYRAFRERMIRAEPLPQCASCNTGFIQDTLDLRAALAGAPSETPGQSPVPAGRVAHAA